MTDLLRAFDYSRVSTTGQKETGHSLETQTDANREFIKEQGWLHVGHDEDDQSGMTLDRPGLDRIRDLIQAREIDVLVVYELDRLSRKYSHQLILRDELKKYRVQLWYAKGGTKSGVTAEELVGENVLGLLAEVEYEKIRERTQRGRRKKAKKGQVIGAGVAPYGYEYVGRQNERQIRVVEAQAKIVRLIFELFVEQNVSVLQIADEMTRRRIPTPGDDDPRVQRKGTPKRHRPAATWGVSSVYRILRQAAYNGEFVHYAHTMQDGHLRVNQEAATRVVVPVERIISPALWEGAQKKIDSGRGLSLRNSRSNDLLLARVLKCDCGRGYQTQRTVHGGISFVYYRCWGRLPAGGRVCKRPHLKQRLLDPFVWGWLTETALNPAWLGEHLRAHSSDADERRRKADSDKDRIMLTLTKEQRRLDRVVDMYRDEDISRDEYRERRREHEEVILDLRQQLAAVDARVERTWGEDEIVDIQTRVADIRSGIDETDPTHRRFVVEQLDLRATLEERDGTLGLFLVCALNDEWLPLPEDEDKRGTHRDGTRGGRKPGSKNKPKQSE